MARPRDFDVEAALDAAVQTFWSRGFAATSVRQLCDAMRIQAGSFYHAFGSKEECFRRALERYLATQRVPREPGPDAIRVWFDAIVDPKRTPKGCLLVMSAIEHPLLDPSSAALVSARMKRVEDFFAACLGDEHDRADAALLASTVVAIHVLARSGTPSSHLRRLADRAMAAVGIEKRARLARS